MLAGKESMRVRQQQRRFLFRKDVILQSITPLWLRSGGRLIAAF